MTLTKQEIDDIAEAFAKSLKRYGISGSDTNSFSSHKTRRSRGASDRPAASIGEMDELLTGSFEKTVKQWKDAHRDATRMLKGSALRDAHQVYVETLEDIAKRSRSVSKKLVQSYENLIKNNKGNHATQQKANDALQKYTDLLKKLKGSVDGYTYDPKDKDGDREQKKVIRNTIRNLERVEDTLNNLGLNIQKTSVLFDKNHKRFEIVNDKYVDEVIDVNEKIIDANEEYVDDLTRLHERELNARQEFVESLANISIKGIGEAIDRTMTTTASRLQNLQASTQYIEAAMNGMSPQEMNEWYNANRNALALQGSSAERQADGLQDTLNKMGYFGAEMMGMITKLNSIHMNSGIGFGKDTSDKILGTIERVQGLEGVTREEAIQMVAEASQSDYFMMNAMGKSDAEQADLLRQQVFSSRQIARATGLTAKYMDQQDQQQLNARNSTIIDKIKTAALMPAYVTEMEKLLQRPISQREAQLMNMERQGVLDLVPGARDEYNAGIGQEFRLAFAKRATDAALDAVDGSVSSRTTSLIAGEVIGQNVGIDATAEALAGARASNIFETVGQAEQIKNYNDLITQAQNSLTAIEDFYNTARAMLVDGAGKSPVGPLLSGIGGFAAGYMADRAIGALIGTGDPGGPGGPGGARPRGKFGRMADMARGLFSRVRGGPGGAPAASSGGWTIGSRVTTPSTPPIPFTAASSGATAASGASGGLRRFLPGPLAAAAGLAFLSSDVSATNRARAAGQITELEATREKGGAYGGIIGGALGGMATGALAGTVVAPGIGTVIAGIGGGILGSIAGSSIGSNIAGAFGGGEEDISAQARAAAEAQRAMTSGAVLGEEGEQAKSLWDRMLETLSGIEENTGDTVATIEQARTQDAELEQQRRAQSAYSAKVRADTESLAKAHTSAMSTSAEGAITSQIGNLDSAWGY